MQNLSPDRVHLTAAEGQSLGEETLRRAGMDTDEARIIAAHVMDAALCGYEYSGLPKILNVVEHKRLRDERVVDPFREAGPQRPAAGRQAAGRGDVDTGDTGGERVQCRSPLVLRAFKGGRSAPRRIPVGAS